MYRMKCDCGHWFDRKDALKRPVSGPEDRSDFLLACPLCGELESFEETWACDGCGEAKGFINASRDQEEFCQKCLEAAMYYHDYEPNLETVRELGLKLPIL